MVDELLAAGGRTTLVIAHRLAEKGVSLVAIPKTVENDTAGTAVTFGYSTAVDLAVSAIDMLQTTSEVDHRVKNSLASIGALLSMKAQRATDEAVQTALEDASIRIRSLSSLHAELHDLAQGERVELRSLFERIERDLRQLLPDGIRLVIEVGNDRVSPSLANALLLIVNEFVSNSVKHGLQDRSGSIAISIFALNPHRPKF